MNSDDAKTILLLYRPGLADPEDPQIAEALALAKCDPELAGWLELHCARQIVIGEKFRQITAPAGLREQIIFEQAASEKMILSRRNIQLAVLAVIILLSGVLAVFWFPPRPQDDTLAVYRNQMAGIALRGYGMDLMTNDPTAIRAYLAQNKAPADYALPVALQNAVVTGCAVQGWQNVKVALICFRTGRPLPPNQASDLWLFVVDRASLKDAPLAGQPKFMAANRLITAVWTQGDKVYLLGAEGDEAVIRKFL